MSIATARSCICSNVAAVGSERTTRNLVSRLLARKTLLPAVLLLAACQSFPGSGQNGAVELTSSESPVALSAQVRPIDLGPYVGAEIPARSGSPEWFGLRLPGPETDPIKGAFETANVDLPARPAVFGPGPTDPVLAGRAVHADLARIVGFALEGRDAGEYLWGRITGRPAFDKTAAWVAAELRSAGLSDTRLENFEADDIHLPIAGEVRLIGNDSVGPGSRDVILQSAMVGGVGPVDGDLTAPLVYVGQGYDAELAGRDLSGKIAVVVSLPSPSLYAAIPSRRIGAVMEAGAAGVIEIQVQAGNLKSFDRDRHGCGTQLCFTVGGEDGFFLLNVLGEAAQSGTPVMASLSARSETLSPVLANVVATIPGKTDRTIIIDAHMDGWFGGADDNGSGLAVMLALARYFKVQPQLDRTLVFVASAGHHTVGANGLLAFRALHEEDYVANADLILNIEHPAQSQMMRAYLPRETDNFGAKFVAAAGDLPKQVAVNNRAPFIVDLWRQGVSCFGLDVQRTVDGVLPGELFAFADLAEVAQTQMIASGGVYHTSADNLASIPPEALERAARFHAYFVRQVADAPIEYLQAGDWEALGTCPPTP